MSEAPLMWEPAHKYHDLRLDYDQTRTFLEYLVPGAVASKTKFVFVRMVSIWNEEKQQLETRAIQNHWTFDEYRVEAKKSQDHGWNFFVCINQTKAGRRRAEDVEKVRAHFLDFDEEPLELPLLVPPDLVVQSKRGQHWYWHTGALDKPETWRVVQRGLIKRFGGDPACCDLPRIMRLPGAYHMKDLRHPFLVNIAYKSASPAAEPHMAAHLALSYDLDTTADPLDNARKSTLTPDQVSQLPPHLVHLFDLFALRGERPQVVKDGWLFKCPHHGDRNPSLLVRLAADGTILLHCRSRRCESDDILHALNVGWGARYSFDRARPSHDRAK